MTGPKDSYELTSREKEILQMISNGFQQKEISVWKHISFETVKSHVRTIRFKLDAANQAHAVAIALRAGIIE